MKIVRPMLVTTEAMLVGLPQNDYPGYSAVTVYALGDRVIVADEHLIYESLQAANTDHVPVSSPTWWLQIGATNRWKAFDGKVNSQAVAGPSEIAFWTIRGAGRIDTVALLNLNASHVHVTVVDDAYYGSGIVYEKTKSLIYDSGIVDWYAYFFEPIVRATEAVFDDLPPYSDLLINVWATDVGNQPGLEASVGEIILGLSRDIGLTKYGASVGIRDYSVKTQNAFGDYTILERAFSRRASFDVWVEAGLTSEVVRLLSLYRATPIIYIGIAHHGATMIYGFFKDFQVVIAYPKHSFCTLDIEGLT